jgi:hypothetical protein
MTVDELKTILAEHCKASAEHHGALARCHKRFAEHHEVKSPQLAEVHQEAAMQHREHAAHYEALAERLGGDTGAALERLHKVLSTQ